MSNYFFVLLKRHPFGKMPLVIGHSFGISLTCFFCVPAVKELGLVCLLSSPSDSAAVELTSLSPYHKNLGRPKPIPETGFLIDLVYEIIALVQKPQLVGCSNNCQTASVLAEILWSTLLIVG